MNRRSSLRRRAAVRVPLVVARHTEFGADPAGLPVERATTFELAVNRKALADLGLTIPPTVLPLVTEWVD